MLKHQVKRKNISCCPFLASRLSLLRWLATSFIGGAVIVLYLLPSYQRQQHRQVSSIAGLSSLDQVLLLSDNNQEPSSDNNNNNNNNIIILYWTKFFQVNDFEVGIGRTPFIKAQCPSVHQSTCWTTTDRGLLNRSRAVIFHARDLDPSDLPPPGWRRPHQHFIYFNYESPVHTDLAKLRLYFNNYFNTTMTYRRDSDVVSLHPYGRLKCRKKRTTSQRIQCLNFPRYSFENQSSFVIDDKDESSGPDDAVTMDLTRKKRTAAWFVSNCVTDSRRESLVQNLSLFIPVDVYGECHGAHQCRNRPECDRMLSRHYRFYLSFENSLCPDYVTEKLYRALAHDTVPVVFGGADYSLYLPAGSYVDARDFDSPQNLADHIKKLMSDDRLYMKHFNWRKNYVVDPAPLDGWCQLCRLLGVQGGATKTYADIAAWWAGKSTNQSCLPPPTSLVSVMEDSGNNTPDAPYVSADYVRKLVNKLRQIIM